MVVYDPTKPDIKPPMHEGNIAEQTKLTYRNQRRKRYDWTLVLIQKKEKKNWYSGS